MILHQTTWKMPSGWPVDEVAVIEGRHRALSLRFRLGSGLELRIPTGCSHDRARAFLLSKRAWVVRHVARGAAHADRLPAPPPGWLWCRGERVHMVHNPSRIAAHLISAEELELDFAHADVQLQRWLNKDLHERVAVCLRALVPAAAHPTKVTIRRMKTRWGSCSYNGSMRLNAALAHLDDRCLRYVLAHECAHLEFMDHSAAFYAHLAQILPTHKEDERHVKLHGNVLVHGGYALPHWE